MPPASFSIVSALVTHDEPQLDRLLALDAHDADHFLRQEASSPTRRVYSAYLERHGHRCMREIEMREKEWAEDPTPIVEAVFSGVRAARGGHVGPSKAEQSLSAVDTRAGRLRSRSRGVRLREIVQIAGVLVTTLFRRAYRTLARQMVDEGLLPDDDVVFFLQHAELGKLLRDRDPELVERALARREVLPFQMKLSFPAIFRGKAEPVDPTIPDGDGILQWQDCEPRRRPRAGARRADTRRSGRGSAG